MAAGFTWTADEVSAAREKMIEAAADIDDAIANAFLEGQPIAEEALKVDETMTFVANAFRDGAVPTAGTAITRILPPSSRFSPGGDHGAKKQRVLDKLSDFFDRYFGLV